MLWIETNIDTVKAERLSQELSISIRLSKLLLAQKLETVEQAKTFLQPRLADLADPFDITHLKEAVHRLIQAREQGQKVLVFGDYDVDGITSVVFFVQILQQLGFYVNYVLPKRLKEGYGLTLNALQRGLEQTPSDLLVALDCGTNSAKEVDYLKSQGIDVIIVDHHKSKESQPKEALLVNPHLFDDESDPWYSLCTVGLVFKLVHGLLKQLRQLGDNTAQSLDIREYLDLVAIGTIADLTPLRHENRILTKAGLRCMQSTRNPGLNALYQSSGLKKNTVISSSDIAFKLSPRINAAGRIGDAASAAELLLSRDRRVCWQQSLKLEELNRKRRQLEDKIIAEAEAQVKQLPENTFGYVLCEPDWHLGVVGIVASRIVQKYHRPCIVLGGQGSMAKGSGRSINGINLIDALKQCFSLLSHWGGHPMAVGLTLPMENLEELRKCFNRSIESMAEKGLPEQSIQITHWLEKGELSLEIFVEVEQLHPFGAGNPEPIFGLRSIVLSHPPEIFGSLSRHYRFRLPLTGSLSSIDVIAWQKAHNMPPTEQALDLTFKLNWNYWNGQRHPQMTLIDWRFSSLN